MCTAVNWGCKHDSVFFFSVVTWSSALLDGKILDLVCSGDSTQPSKVIQGGFFEGRQSLYPATLSTTHFFMSVCPKECKNHLMLFKEVWWWNAIYAKSLHLLFLFCAFGWEIKSFVFGKYKLMKMHKCNNICFGYVAFQSCSLFSIICASWFFSA